MADLYDYCAHRAVRLLGGLFRRAQQVRLDVADCRAKYSAVGLLLEKCVRSLERFESQLQTHQLSCEKALKYNEECRRVLEQDDLDALVEYRGRLADALRDRS